MTSLLIDHVGSSGTDDKSTHQYHVGSSGTDDKYSHRSRREQWDR